MKYVEIQLNENGSIKYNRDIVMFDNENKAIEIKLKYPKEYEDYNKQCDIIGGSGLQAIVFGDLFTLSKNELQKGYMKLQPIARLNDKVVKWEITSLYVNDSLNVLENDDAIENSVGEALLQLIETKQDKINIDPTWNNLDKLLKGVIE